MASRSRPGSRWQPAGVRKVGRQKRRSTPSLALPELSGRTLRIALAGTAIGLVAIGGYTLYESPVMGIRGVEVQGARTLDAPAVRAAAGLEHESFVRPDFAAAEERVRALPLVKDVEITRDFPIGATIKVVERTPWAVWHVNGQALTVDEDGYVLDMPAPPGAPVIVQTDAPQAAPAPGGRVDRGAMHVARQLLPTAEQTLGQPIAGLEFSQASGLTAVFPDGLRVTFGDAQGYEFKLAALFAVLQRAREEGRSLAKVDLRFGDRVAVQWGGADDAS